MVWDVTVQRIESSIHVFPGCLECWVCKNSDKGCWNQNAAALECEAKGGWETASNFEQGSEHVFLLFSRTKGPSFMVPLKLRKESQSDKKNPRNFVLVSRSQAEARQCFMLNSKSAF